MYFIWDTERINNTKIYMLGYIIADESGKTSVDGLFAAGDVRTKSLRQIITACSDGANCVDSVNKYFDETAD